MISAYFREVRLKISAEPKEARKPVTTQLTSNRNSGWVHLCNGLDPKRDGGMVPSILGMTGALAALGGDLRIVTPTPSQTDAFHVPDGVLLEGPVRSVRPALRDSEVAHLHGLWQRHTREGAAAARHYRVPYLITAHGMAEPWALRHKAWKKRIYRALVEGRNLRLASCLHALSRPEVMHLRALVPKAEVCFVPNGVDLEPFDHLPDKAALEAEHPEIKGTFKLLFLGRLHPKKGLDLLAEALGRLANDFKDLHLLLAGHDDGSLKPFQKEIGELGLTNRITYLGHLSRAEALKAWAAADAFILPSYSEGFSMAILEAMAARLPVLATTACHFPELADNEAGLVVTPTIEGVTNGIRSLLERSNPERAALGNRARMLVESEYTWDRQAERLSDVYQWLVGGGPAPEAVQAANS